MRQYHAVKQQVPGALLMFRLGDFYELFYDDAITAAQPFLSEFGPALLRGHLHLCGNCCRYTFGQDPAGMGTCTLYGDGLIAFAMPFECDAFEPSATPSAPEYLPCRTAAQPASEEAGARGERD